MVRRFNSSQFRSRLNQIQQKQRRAITDYNNALRRLNTAVTNYNREARAHDARVRAHQARLRNELAKLRSISPSVTRQVTYRASVQTLHRSWIRVETASQRSDWRGGTELLNLSEGETANSVAVLNALTEVHTGTQADADDPALRQTAITNELTSIDPDLDARWRGALYALSARNPDAARHFCASSREILTAIVDKSSNDAEILTADPSAQMTQDGRVTRRARIEFYLRRRGEHETELADFVLEDLNNVVALFHDVNEGTHGVAGKYSLTQLRTLKNRVEEAIRFLYRVVI